MPRLAKQEIVLMLRCFTLMCWSSEWDRQKREAQSSASERLTAEVRQGWRDTCTEEEHPSLSRLDVASCG